MVRLSVSRTLGVSAADLKGRIEQNLARQYAANFGKHGTRDPANHQLIQNTESVLVTTTMDLASPRGDGGDCSDDGAELEVSPRGFFADQFEVGFVFLSQLVFSLYAPARIIPWVFLRACF